MFSTKIRPALELAITYTRNKDTQGIFLSKLWPLYDRQIENCIYKTECIQLLIPII